MFPARWALLGRPMSLANMATMHWRTKRRARTRFSPSNPGELGARVVSGYATPCPGESASWRGRGQFRAKAVHHRRHHALPPRFRLLLRSTDHSCGLWWLTKRQSSRPGPRPPRAGTGRGGDSRRAASCTWGRSCPGVTLPASAPIDFASDEDLARNRRHVVGVERADNVVSGGLWDVPVEHMGKFGLADYI